MEDLSGDSGWAQRCRERLPWARLCWACLSPAVRILVCPSCVARMRCPDAGHPVSTISRSRTVAGHPCWPPLAYHPGCENFLYVFKAAPRGRSGRRLGGPPSLTPRLPCRRSPTPVGWPETPILWAAKTHDVHRGSSSFTAVRLPRPGPGRGSLPRCHSPGGQDLSRASSASLRAEP